MSDILATIDQALNRLATGHITAAALAAACFDRIADPRGEGRRSFIRLFEAEAMSAARHVDERRANGAALPPLSGIPVSVKDLCDIGGSVTLAGSRALAGHPAAAGDAPVIYRLRTAGAVIVGTTNMTEFAMGTPGINPHYGTPLNPYDRNTGRIPGGSSSGAAVSVADGMAVAALGTDTAGSVRVPAALCGLAGFKPTARRVPSEGTVPLAPSLDSIGPIARSVACCNAIDAILAGARFESLDPIPLDGLRLGLPKQGVCDEMQPHVADSFDRAMSRLTDAGARIVAFDFPVLQEMAELNAQGSHSVIEGYAWHRALLEERGDDYDPIVAARLRAGADVRAADYIALCAGRNRLIAHAGKATRDFDAVIMPTVPIVAPPLVDFVGNDAYWLATNRLLLRNPFIANFLDRCALTIPCHRPGTAPVGFTCMGENGNDKRLLRVGLAVESAIAIP